MKTNGVPAIIMLAAGFIDCVIAILTHMSLWNFTRQLLLVLVLFYVIGCVVKMIIDRNFKDMEDDQNREETEESKEEQEAESVLKLSHSFCQKTDEPELELIVKVLNINLDKKQRILETCCLLKEYMLLVDKIRKYAAEYKDINRAAEQAVTECIEENILADFLRKNRTEAIEVCIFEYDEKREKELIRKAEFAEGEKIGREAGEKIGRETGVKEGIDRVLEIYSLFRKKHTESQIAAETGLELQAVREILERFEQA